MNEPLALSTAFILGLLGGTHCLGMCGGIAATVSMSAPQGWRGSLLLGGYNIGRIASYTAAGALIGSLSWLMRDPQIVIVLRTFAGLMLIAMGLYVAQWWQGLTYIEKAGGTLWKQVQPLASKLLPVKSLSQAVALGLVWGWLPCGLVYSTLIWSSAAADWTLSAQLMLMFGLGTLPTMLLTGLLAQRVKLIFQQRLTRSLFGIIIMVFGVYTLPWQGLLAH
ncbi:sulfite exporter TauE/SafE family protein [Pontibacterium sp. N1Y112]|uniref:Sulfite exporter TauE/SafE family protein n=1 Tax=Pontibacterium sinense TaxID=2781979 RepID=A0A8J7FIK3_9GAMM|nr:sulfite exporter TauE/SafE family protein [Pontibacterium sinense]MBE9399681.1 sulfite exporter TauE/SafE family protein [Pontibacterium sinense]